MNEVEWYSPRDIYFRPEHMYFLITHLKQLEQGDYPDDPSNYVDNVEDPTQYDNKGLTEIGAHTTTFIVNRHKLEVCAGLAAEVTYRLDRAGKDGRILKLEIQTGTEIPYLSHEARNALWYISGWKRKVQPYSVWKADRNNRLKTYKNIGV